jgi:ribosomal-protein-alanine N-acetyltransferase
VSAAARILLRPPTADDETAFLVAIAASHRLHAPWVAPPATPEAYATWLNRMATPTHHAVLVCRRDDSAIAGVLHLSQIVHGNFRSAYLGYYAMAGQERQGLMRAGLQALLRQAFGPLKLHRLEANIQPGNTASVALARSCGFVREGFSPRYLMIAGRWRDHERWAIVAR